MMRVSAFCGSVRHRRMTTRAKCLVRFFIASELTVDAMEKSEIYNLKSQMSVRNDLSRCDIHHKPPPNNPIVALQHDIDRLAVRHMLLLQDSGCQSVFVVRV
jgi:hypothetical protein